MVTYIAITCFSMSLIGVTGWDMLIKAFPYLINIKLSFPHKFVGQSGIDNPELANLNTQCL